MTYPYSDDDVRAVMRAQIESYREQLPPSFQQIWDELTGTRSARISPTAPAANPADAVPRRRNPRLWCEQHENGTWIHGTPHNCPRWARR